MCGEKAPFLAGAHIYHGSPPRVRGKDRGVPLRHCYLGITPACAGKRNCIKFFWIDTEDHPRVCGEKKTFVFPVKIDEGSPPRVRGKGGKQHPHSHNAGITPACAGKRLKKAHKIKDFDPVPIRFHLVFRRFERWCSNLPTPDGNVPV